MNDMTGPLTGEVSVPGDKSISHRAVMFGALAKGDTRIRGFLNGADCLSTIDCFCRLGIEIESYPSYGSAPGDVLVHGRGLHGLSPSSVYIDHENCVELYTGNSGTTTRIMSGILSAQSFSSILSGDASVNRRPMKRVTDPLKEMGADISSLNEDGCAPLLIRGNNPLKGIVYSSPVASAQVKSAILCAGLYADGPVKVYEPALSRDHTERMLKMFGAYVFQGRENGRWYASVKPCGDLYAPQIIVPGDISSAAFLIAAALMIKGSDILIRSVGINPTRSGILTVLKEMGADITIENITSVAEPYADLRVRYSDLHGTVIEGGIIPSLIDELPVIAVIASAAEGATVIRDAAELKVKESDRIALVTQNLQAMGADITATEDGFVINGPCRLHGAAIRTDGDHRIAMSFAVAGLAADGDTVIDAPACVSVSYPGFYDTIERLGGEAP